MKLHSKFQDYYDSAIGYGVDPNIQYVRRTYEVEDAALLDKMLDHFEELRGSKSYWGDKTYFNNHDYYKHGYVGFCGQAYPFIYLNKLDQGRWKYNITPKYKVGDYIFKPFTMVADINSGRRVYQDKMGKGEQYFSPFDCSQFNIELGEPIFIFYAHEINHTERLVMNPFLKDLKFAKIVDPFTAFQEISMFIGNELAMSHPPDLVEISDKDMATKKGFGHKYAFRKEPKL